MIKVISSVFSNIELIKPLNTLIMTATSTTGSLRTVTKERLQSLDTLRGFDMAMLVGLKSAI